MEEINFTEPQLRAVEGIKKQSFIKGIYVGMGMLVLTAIGIAIGISTVYYYSI